MLGASLYLIVCSARNRIRTRLRRLREPRYLVGAIVGSAYLYFAVFNRGRGGPGGSRPPGRGLAGLAPAWQATGSTLGGLGLFALAAAAWLLPAKSGLLEFSRAEAAFLFPAPVTRRQLLLHKVMRSQIGSLLASIVVVVFFAPASASARLQFAVAMWAIFVTARVYFAGIALTRARLSSRETAPRHTAAWLAVAICVAAVLVVFGAIVRQFAAQPAASLPDLAVRLARTTATGLPAVLLWPFAAVLRPLAAPDLATYLAAVTGSFAVLAVTMLWMLAGAEAFDLESAESGVEGAEAAARRAAPRARAVGWTLPLTGRAEGLFVWKNAMQTFRASDTGLLRVGAPIAVALIGLSFAVMAANRLRGAAGVVSTFSLVVSAFAVLFGPQIMRLDLRADLSHLDVLKTWPVRSASVIRGEILWPASVVTAIVWMGLAGATLFSETAFPRMPPEWRWVLAVSGIIVAPALVAPQYVVHNAIAVFFPAWVPTSLQPPRGVDAMGQRLIMLAGVIVSLLLFSVPGALAGGLVWLASRSLLGAAALVPASVLFMLTVLVEVLMATELLGPAYDRLDLTSVERGE